MFNAARAYEVATCKTICEYDELLESISKEIQKQAYDHNFSTSVRICGKDWTTTTDTIKAIKRTLKQYGYKVHYDSDTGFLDISWRKFSKFMVYMSEKA